MDETAFLLELLHLLDLPSPVSAGRRVLAVPEIVSPCSDPVAGSIAGNQLIAALLIFMSEMVF
jgi:hypothetical protein